MATKRRASKKSESSTLGQRLARFRRLRGLTQTDLADKLGLSQPNISDYERDLFRPNSDTIVRIAQVLKISADELLGLRVSKSQPSVSPKLLKRLAKIESLPKRDQQALLRTIDAFLSKAS